MVQSNLGPDFALAKDLSDLKERLARLEAQTNQQVVDPGGTTGKPLIKLSDNNFDTAWQTLEVVGGGTGLTTATGYLKGSGSTISTVTAVPSSDGGVPTGGSTNEVLQKTSGSNYAVGWSNTFTSPTITSGNLNNPLLTRIDSSNEGGQINFARASDGTQTWFIDSFGNTTTPSLRIVDGATERLSINGSGAVLFSSQAGTSGQVLASAGSAAAPTWVSAGLVPIIPTLSVSGGSGTVGTNGLVTLSACTTFILDNIFRATYRNYKIIANLVSTANGNWNYRLRNTTPADISTANYWTSEVYGGTAAPTNLAATGQTTGRIGYATIYRRSHVIEIVGPYISTEATTILTQAGDVSTVVSMIANGLYQNISTTGINFSLGVGGTFSGTIQVFGYGGL